MKSEDLFDAVGGIRESFIRAAARPSRRALGLYTAAVLLAVIVSLSVIGFTVNAYGKTNDLPADVEIEHSRPETDTAETARDSEKDEEPVIELSFLQKEKENDPIFTWEDPHADLSPKEIDRLQDTMSAEEYNEYFHMHFNRQYAEENYPVYYYYYSGRSEYKEGMNNDNPAYELPMIASYSVPESFILNMLADACVEMHIKEVVPVTIERTYQDEEEREKMENMGEEPMYEAVNLVFTVDRCLWGDMEGNDEIFVFPRFMSQEFIDILSDPAKTFVAFLWRSEETGAYNQTGLPEYAMLVRGTFDYTEGTLRTYSNLEDVAAYNGMTAEEMLESGRRQAEKYKELLDYVRSR